MEPDARRPGRFMEVPPRSGGRGGALRPPRAGAWDAVPRRGRRARLEPGRLVLRRHGLRAGPRLDHAHERGDRGPSRLHRSLVGVLVGTHTGRDELELQRSIVEGGHRGAHSAEHRQASPPHSLDLGARARRHVEVDGRARWRVDHDRQHLDGELRRGVPVPRIGIGHADRQARDPEVLTGEHRADRARVQDRPSGVETGVDARDDEIGWITEGTEARRHDGQRGRTGQRPGRELRRRVDADAFDGQRRIGLQHTERRTCAAPVAVGRDDDNLVVRAGQRGREHLDALRVDAVVVRHEDSHGAPSLGPGSTRGDGPVRGHLGGEVGVLAELDQPRDHLGLAAPRASTHPPRPRCRRL